MDNISLVAFKNGNSPLYAKDAFWDDETENKIDIAWLFYLINYEDRHILVDVGNSNIAEFAKYGFEMRDFRAPVDLLEQYGLLPNDITDIFITHADFDHVGDIGLYTNANIYIQQNELINCRDVIGENRKVITFDKSLVVFDRFQLTCVAGHTVGSSIISFQYGDFTYVLGGDACYVNESLERQIPTGRTYDVDKSREFIQQFSQPQYRVFLSHEPSIVAENDSFTVILR